MLHTLRTRAGSKPADEPAELLLACHGRLRHFSATAVALATRLDLDEKQIDEACGELVRYFRVALPLHEADEEVTLAPRLEPLMTDAGALDRMRRQHVAIHDTLDVLLPQWDARDVRATSEPAHVLAALLDAHLTLEETVIFPCLSQIPAPDRKRLFEEMRARRSF